MEEKEDEIKMAEGEKKRRKASKRECARKTNEKRKKNEKEMN